MKHASSIQNRLGVLTWIIVAIHATAQTGCEYWTVRPNYVVRHSDEGASLDVKEVAVTRVPGLHPWAMLATSLSVGFVTGIGLGAAFHNDFGAGFGIGFGSGFASGLVIGVPIDLALYYLGSTNRGYDIFTCDRLRLSHAPARFSTEKQLKNYLGTLGCHPVGAQPAPDGLFYEHAAGFGHLSSE